MSKVHRRATDDLGLRELSENDLGALGRLARANEPQAPRKWGRLRVLIADELRRRTGITQARLQPGGARLKAPQQFVSPLSAMDPGESRGASNSIESVWRELRHVALQYTTDGAQARALCRVFTRLGYDQALEQVADGTDAKVR